MLKNQTVAATLPATDLNRAISFYRDKLGLSINTDNPGIALCEAGQGTSFVIYERGPTKADHTVLTFSVPDIETEVADLRQKGIVFEEYDVPDLKTVDGISTTGNAKAAWFKDTEGNIIGIAQM